MNPRISVKLIAASLLFFALPALASPPSHAPAHGWRKKHDPYYQGYTGKKWQDDYGITEGRCDSSRLLGAMAGEKTAEAVGDTIGGDAGAVVGVIAGVLIEDKINRKIDRVDRGCVSHALDIGSADRPVRWTNPETRREYSVTPRQTRQIDGRLCRDLDWSTGIRQTACLNSEGAWMVLRP